jgi:hypothetical protein
MANKAVIDTYPQDNQTCCLDTVQKTDGKDCRTNSWISDGHETSRDHIFGVVLSRSRSCLVSGHSTKLRDVSRLWEKSQR